MQRKILIIGLALLLILGSGCTGKETPQQQKDSDGDGWTDAFEIGQGTNPNNPDTDGDGIIDSKDPEPLVAEKETAPTTTPPPTTTEPPTTAPPTSFKPITYWWNEKAGVHSVEIWEIRESDSVNVKKNGLPGEVKKAGTGEKFIILNVTVTKEITTPSGWALSFKIVDEKKKKYDEYVLNWMVYEYLDKNIDVGESKTGLLVFRVPEETQALQLYCFGCPKRLKSGYSYYAIIDLPPMRG